MSKVCVSPSLLDFLTVCSALDNANQATIYAAPESSAHILPACERRELKKKNYKFVMLFKIIFEWF